MLLVNELKLLFSALMTNCIFYEYTQKERNLRVGGGGGVEFSVSIFGRETGT